MANKKVENEGMTVIQKRYCLELLRGVINSYGLTTNFLKKSYTIPSVANQEEYIIDLPNINNISSITYNDQNANFEFITEQNFKTYEPYFDNVTFFTLMNNGDFFNKILLKPIPTEDGLPILISYYSAGNEPIPSMDSFLNFPNQFVFNLIDSLIFKYIEVLPPEDRFKKEQMWYYQKDLDGKKQFSAWMNSLKNADNGFKVKYNFIANTRSTY